MFKKPERSDLELINNYQPFLYKLVGTWAFSPHPKKWREFLDWFNSLDSEKFDPYVPGLVTSDWLHMHTTMGKRHMTWVSQLGSFLPLGSRSSGVLPPSSWPFHYPREETSGKLADCSGLFIPSLGNDRRDRSFRAIDDFLKMGAPFPIVGCLPCLFASLFDKFDPN